MTLTPLQQTILEKINADMNQSEIAREMGVSHQAINKIVRKLKAKGVAPLQPPATPCNPPHTVPETTGSGIPPTYVTSHKIPTIECVIHNITYKSKIEQGKEVRIGFLNRRCKPLQSLLNNYHGFDITKYHDAQGLGTSLIFRPTEQTCARILREASGNFKQALSNIETLADDIGERLKQAYKITITLPQLNTDPHACILDDPAALEWAAQKSGFYDNGTWRIDKSPQDGTLETNDMEAAQAYRDTFTKVLTSPRGHLDEDRLNGYIDGATKAGPAFIKMQAQMENLNAQLGGLQTLPQVLEQMNETLNHVVRTQVQLANANLAVVKAQKRKATAPEDEVIMKLFGGRR